MDLLRASSPSASTSSSLDSNGLPHCRIQCDKSRILVGSTKFESATDALVAYLKQFDLNGGHPSPIGQSSGGHHSPALSSSSIDLKAGTVPSPQEVNGQTTDYGGGPLKGIKDVASACKSIAGTGLILGDHGLHLASSKEDVENLLTSKVSHELKEEVTDTLREVKLRHLLKKAAMNNQKQTKTGLQQEVEAALARSAKLLERVTQDDIAANKITLSDLRNASLSPPTMVNGDSIDDSILSLDSSASRERKNGHTYSYHQFRPRATSRLKSPPSPSDHRRSRLREKSSSLDSLIPPHLITSPPITMPSLGSSNSISNNSDPSDVINRIRSKSVPPSPHRQRVQQAPDHWLGQLDQSVSKSVPSWVKSINPSEVSDSLWLSKSLTQTRAVPSWIEDVDNLDNGIIDDSINESLLVTSRFSNPSKKSTTQKLAANSQDDADMRYLQTGLNSDVSLTNANLNDSQTLNSVKHVTFGESEPLRSAPNIVHSTPIPRYKDSKYSKASLGQSRVMDSAFNGEAYLHNNILPQTARLKKSMENFASSTENLRKSLSSNSSDASSDNKCSSLDTFALLTGRTVLKSDILTKNHNPKGTQNIFPDSLAISSISPAGSQGQGHLSNGHSSSDGLDGDRPWEAMTNTFKPPVPVGGDSCANPFNNDPAADIDVAKGNQRLSTSLSGGNQPGSMEALKNMIFKLQAEENSVQNKNADAPDSNDAPPASTDSDIPALQDYNFQMEPGGHSLEKALLHLNRLKNLVKTTGVPSKSPTPTSASEGQNN